MTKITARVFLEALDLPLEHPYVRPQLVYENSRHEWSLSSYLSSWKDAQKDSVQDCSSSSSIQEYNTRLVPIQPSRARRQSDTFQAVCSRTVAVAENQNPSSSLNEAFFFHEIQPCLMSMLYMNIVLWAPLVLFLCLKRLYIPCKATAQQPESKPNSSPVSISMQSLPRCMLSLPSYMPTLKRATMAREKQKRETQQTYPNSSFERMLLLLSLAISVMTSYSAFFSMEEEKQESKPSSPKDCNVRKDDINDDRRNGFHRRKKSSGDNTMSQGPFVLTSEWGVYVLALFFSAVVMNDAMYALAFPRSNLIAMHIFFIYLSMKRFGSKKAFKTTFPITAVAFYIMSGQQHDLPAIEPGLYYDETNRFISRVVKHWPVDKRTYDDGRGTPWMITGDTRTGLPFMVNKIPKLNFVRRWVPLHEEEEAVILDIALPEIVDNDTKVYLVLHGINGDSNEGYVVDFASRQVSEGNIVAVMVTRGLGDSPIVNGNILHFARLSDVRAAARALRNAINQVNPNLLLAGVGYSMGAITLANYVAQSNPTDIDVAVAFSGALDTTQQVKFSRSVSLWQPFIAKAMRDTLLSRYTNEISQRLDHEQLKEIMMAKSLVEFDDAFFVPYHNFDSLEDYYSRMGAMADFDTNGYLGRIANVSIPLLSVSSLDDPIAYWKAYHDPSQVSKAGAGNNVLLFTETGGHVGWPLGWNPANHGWRWMSDVASSFVESVDHAHKHPSLE